MQSLKRLADKAARAADTTTVDDTSSNLHEEIWNLNNTIQEQKLHLLELEEEMGSVSQENAWLQEEVADLKVQIMELELMIYGYSTR